MSHRNGNGATLVLLAVFDLKLGAYIDAPLGAPTRGVGERDFESEVNNPNSRFNKYPEDFELHEVGTFDLVTGVVTNAEPRPIVYGRAAAFKRKEA